MRRVIVLALLFGLMYVLQFLQVSAEAPFNAYSLATVGFILLAAYTFGEITGKIGMPKITGYIFTGLLFGPYVINLFSVEVVNDLKTINDLAIGLIALSAGGEMKVSSLKKIARSLTLIVLVKGGLILVAVTLAVWAVSPLMPFLAAASTPLILAVGMLFGVLAIGTSPAATIAVINETGARGRLSDTTLGVAVFKDVVMVVLLAIAIALAKVFSSPDGVFDPHVLLIVGEELGLSMLAGAVLGGLILLYIRFIHAEMWLFIIGIIFAMTAFAQLFHLEALLLFIVAGFVVQNFSKHGDDFVHLIEGVALPVYVVFFSVAGAGLDLSALAAVGVVAMTLVVVRIGAIWGGTFLATKLANEPEPIRKNAWLAFISQAGVVLGLTIIIENNLPELGPEIRVVVLGTIAVNLVAGPILFKMALARVGEVGQREAGEAGHGDGHDAPDADADADAPAESDTAEDPDRRLPAAPPDARLPEPRFEAEALQREAQDLLHALAPIRSDFETNFVRAQTSELAGFFNRVRNRYFTLLDDLADDLEGELDAADTKALTERFRAAHINYARWLLSTEITFAEAQGRAEKTADTFQTLFDAIHGVAMQAEERVVVSQEEARYQTLGSEGLGLRVGKAFKRAERNVRRVFGGGQAAKRVVPVRRMALYHLEGTLPGEMESTVNLLAAYPLYALERVRGLYSLIDEQFIQLFAHLRGGAASDGAATQPTLEAPSEAPSETASEAASEVTLGTEVLAAMRAESEAAFDQARADLDRYGADIRQHFAFAFGQSLEALFADLAVVGTFELPVRKRRYSDVYDASQEARTAQSEAVVRWQGYTQGLAGAFAKHLDVSLLTDRVEAAIDDTVLALSDDIRTQLEAHVQAANEACAAVHDALVDTQSALADAEGKATLDLGALLAGHQQDLGDTLESEALAPLRALRESRALNALLDDLLQRFGALANEVPNVYTLIHPEDLPPPRKRGALPPPPKLRVAPMREVVRNYLDTKVAGHLARANQTLVREVEAVLFALAEVSHVVRFNLQAALDELDKEGGDPAQALPVALGGLDRALARVEKTRAQINQLDETVHTQILSGTKGLTEGLEKAIAGQTERSLRLQREQDKARARVTTTLRRAWEVVRVRGLLFSRAVRQRLQPFAEEVVRDYRATLPLAELTPEEVLSRREQALLEPARLQALPFIYQKLFAFAPLESDDFLVGRSGEIETFMLAQERWAAGRACAVAVIGEPGIGTTSFLGHLRRLRFADAPVHEVFFERMPDSEEQLAGQLAKAAGLPRSRTLDAFGRRIATRLDEARPVIILHDLHHLYRPAPGGFELLKQLLLLIATTGDRVRWVASMNRPAWEYLEAAVEISDAFTFYVNLKGLGREELETALVARHRLSGLELAFVPSEVMRQRRKYRRADEEDRAAMLRDAFFGQLHRITGGNPLAAQFHWLRSIEEVGADAMVLRMPERLKLGYVQALDLHERLTLTVLIRRGYLTIEEHAALFGFSPDASRATLTHLANLNLLFGSEEGTYRLNRPVYKALVAELKAMNVSL